jgi:uncharacterized SAM-binding protein YcdF (DUF218 family)
MIFKQGVTPKIFITNDGLQGGWKQNEKQNPYFAERARWELIEHGVPEEAIEILSTVANGTNDEANLFVKISTQRKLKTVLLVTSAYHSRWTLLTFERVISKGNLPVNIGVKSPPTGQQTPSPFSWWLSEQGWKIVIEEYVKSAYYWLFY